MTITKHLPLVTLLLPLVGCPDPDAVATPGDDSSSGSEGGITSSTSGEVDTSSSTSSSTSSGHASLDGTAGTSTGGPEPIVPRATVIMQTSGGGRVSSTAFAARIRIGAPQPVGHTSSPLHQAHLGPGSVQ